MSACARCGSDNRPGARFCGVCGNPITAAPTGKGTAMGKAVAVPVVVPTAVEPTPAPSANPRPPWLIPLALAAVAIVVGGAVGLLVAGGGDDTTTATAEPSGDDGSTSGSGDGDGGGGDSTTDAGDDQSESTDNGDDDPDETETTDPPATSDEPAIRSGTLYSNYAKLRTGPNINNPEVAILQREGAPLQIIGRHQSGWYEVRMDGHQGWLFGAFVNPPPTGHQIIQASSGNIVLRSSAGVPLGITNESGPKALATGSTGNLFRVILPNGETAYVSRNDVFVAIP